VTRLYWPILVMTRQQQTGTTGNYAATKKDFTNAMVKSRFSLADDEVFPQHHHEAPETSSAEDTVLADFVLERQLIVREILVLPVRKESPANVAGLKKQY
jgi:hypothetical protein